MTPGRTAAICASTLWMLASCAPLPEVPVASKVVWLDQNWTAAQRQWFHHVSQGTATLPVPYEWFMALEQAELKPFGTPALFSDAAHLRRWGFIDSPVGSGNPGGLPVGFADNMPMGLQLAAPRGCDDRLLAVAAWCEARLPFRGLV